MIKYIIERLRNKEGKLYFSGGDYSVEKKTQNQDINEVVKSLALTTERLSFLVEKLLLVTLDLKNREYNEKQSEKPNAGNSEAKGK
jgi:hypothetical protein